MGACGKRFWSKVAEKSMVIFFLIFFLIRPIYAFSANLSDIEGNFAQEEISMLFTKGILKGDGTNFFPNKPITRAEFTKMLVVTLEYEEDTEEIKNYPQVFSDIKNHWAAGYIITAWELGIVKGEEGKFYPDRSLNRIEMTAMLLRAFRENTADGREIRNLGKFKDKNKIPGWAKPYVSSAVSSSIVVGTAEGLLEPLRSATRAEAAKVLARMAALKGYVYDYVGTLSVKGERAKEVTLLINAEPVSFALADGAAVYSEDTRVSIEELNGKQVYIILDKNKEVGFIKSSGE